MQCGRRRVRALQSWPPSLTPQQSNLTCIHSSILCSLASGTTVGPSEMVSPTHLHKSIPNFTYSDKDSDFCINDFRFYSQFLFQALKVNLTSIYNFPFTSEMVSKLPLDFRFCITRKELNKRT